MSGQAPSILCRCALGLGTVERLADGRTLAYPSVGTPAARRAFRPGGGLCANRWNETSSSGLDGLSKATAEWSTSA